MRQFFLALISTMLIFSCSQSRDEDFAEDFSNLKSQSLSGCDVYVAPSGDLSGVTDANNIELALDEVKSCGGTVFLTDGNKSSVDHYYTSKNIVITGFQGVLTGESLKNTQIHVVRKSASVGFEGAFSPWWSQTDSPYTLPTPTVFQLDNAAGDVIIRNLSIFVKDDQPSDIHPDYYGINTTCISTIIEILGGEHNTCIENIRIEGKETTAEGNVLGMNIDVGIHVMLGSPVAGINDTGTLSIKNVEVENTGNGAILFMRFAAGSMVSVENVRATNVGQGVYAGGIFDSQVNISDNYFSTHATGYQGIALWNIPSGLQIVHNTIRESRYFGISLWDNVHNATVSDNTFIDLMKKLNFSAILTYGSGNTFSLNDYRESKLPGWTDETNGPGAIILTASSSNNLVHEMKFPTGNFSLCEMISDRTDNPGTPEYDGLNNIHNYQPCDNRASRNMAFEEEGLGFFAGYKHNP
ncbi:right-handed parallel beta-helix repeat-containing protein [Mangrovibacterium lignilyticum]|uniref:right-handed parallel beta-helix repeat-containing protein n=1 Tax=Mangrovibacterium lignilyticum TaxID=2668052 RepID=UPI0013D3513E|nr:right-handed parallel beta-helix repeat-containing protein [Mangrovibacterium lignilyticum]